LTTTKNVVPPIRVGTFEIHRQAPINILNIWTLIPDQWKLRRGSILRPNFTPREGLGRSPTLQQNIVFVASTNGNFDLLGPSEIFCCQQHEPGDRSRCIFGPIQQPRFTGPFARKNLNGRKHLTIRLTITPDFGDQFMWRQHKLQVAAVHGISAKRLVIRTMPSVWSLKLQTGPEHDQAPGKK